MKEDREVLEAFLKCPLSGSDEVMNFFSALPGSKRYCSEKKKNFVYVPGKREDRIVLIAHADTVWDSCYFFEEPEFEDQKLIWEDGLVRGLKKGMGIGADDRAGCAMLYLLRNSGHSLLITDGEEYGQIGVHYMEESCPEIFNEINHHHYALQLDRRGSCDYKFYNLNVGDDFIRFIQEKTGYQDAGRKSRTDIVPLCKRMCGVNLSVGYHFEHTEDEYLVLDEWQHTLDLVRNLLKEKQPRFVLQQINDEL